MRAAQCHCSRFTPRERTPALATFLVAFQLALTPIIVARAAQQGNVSFATCAWLPWHPAATDGAGEAVPVETPPQICTSPSFVTDFYANTTLSSNDSASIRSLSGRCSDGSLLGFYGLPDSFEKPQASVSSSTGFTAINGSGDTFLESFGDALYHDSEWSDLCPSDTVVTGYQIKFVPGAPISRIRLLCSQPSSPRCGLKETGMPATAMAPDLRLAPGPSEGLQYVIFGIQWPTKSNLTIYDIESQLQSSSILQASMLLRVGPECSAAAVAEAGSNVECYEAGPVSAETALQLVSQLTRASSGGMLGGALPLTGSPANGVRVLFAAISEQSILRSKIPSQATAPLAMLSGNDRAAHIGIITGCITGGLVLLALTIVLFTLLYLRKRKAKLLELKYDAQNLHSDHALAKKERQLPRISPANKVVVVASSPFGAANAGWKHASASSPDEGLVWPAQRSRSQEPSPERQQLPPSYARPQSHLTDNAIWAVRLPDARMPFVPRCFTPPNAHPLSGGSCARLGQDSDEIMDGEGHNAWKVMHDDVVQMSKGPSSSVSTATVSEQMLWPNPSLEQPSLSISETPSRRNSLSDWEIWPTDLQICQDPNGHLLELGCGAFGKVYRALLDDVTEVAVKRLEASSAAQRALFRREIDIHKRCRSAHVVQFLGACIQTDCMFLVTELMDTSLDRVVHDDTKQFSWLSGGKLVALDVAQALAYLHKQRVVHLDIKSSNVLLTREGRAKIADVGLSQVLQHTYLSQIDGQGTFAYAAPELLSGGSNCGTKADIWSYGVLLHEIVTRELPKRGALSDRSPDACPEHIDELIRRCLARDPEDRPSAKAIIKLLEAECPEAIANALRACRLETHRVDAPSVDPTSRPRPRPRPRPLLADFDLISDAPAEFRRWSCS